VRRAALILAALVALALPAVALAATRHFTGSTDQGLRVAFDLASKKVKHFKAKVRCTSTTAQTFSFPTMPVNSRGRFSVHQAGPSLDGRIKGRTARGTLILPGCNANANEVKFTAHAA
jgi:hypothetical protein